MANTVREALVAFRRSPILVILSASMIGLSLFVIGLFGIAAHNVRLVLDRIESRVEIVAYLMDDAPTESVQLALADVRAFPEVLEAIYIGRDQALETAQRELPEFGTLFTDLDVNPLPASLEIRLLPGYRDPQTVSAVASRVTAFPFVEDVRFGREWLDKVFLLRQIAGAAALVVGGAFATVSVLIIGAAIRMAIFARREEITIMRLVGATDGYIRRPFLLEGLLTGLIGGGIALGLAYAVFWLLSDSIVQLEWIPDTWIAGGIATGGMLGLLAARSAVKRHLREI